MSSTSVLFKMTVGTEYHPSDSEELLPLLALNEDGYVRFKSHEKKPILAAGSWSLTEKGAAYTGTASRVLVG